MPKVMVQEQLEEILDSKADLKQAINNNGGEVTNSTTFRNYVGQIQVVIDKNVIPYSDLYDTMMILIRINGEEV